MEDREAANEGNPPPTKRREKKWLNYDNRLAAIIESYEDHDDKLDFHKIVGSMMSV